MQLHTNVRICQFSLKKSITDLSSIYESTELNSKLKTRNVIIAEKSQTFSVNKGAALTKNFSFDAKSGYTRNLIIFYISGTGSDSAVVNMHANGNVSVFAPNMNSNITVVVRCLYTPD